jgi:hypothetical protein
MKKKDPYIWLRWTARVFGTVMVLFTLFMFIGESIDSIRRHEGSALASFSPLILVIFATWGIALAGLILALWNEGLGGGISLAFFMLTYILNLFNKEAAMRGDAITVFFFFSIPSILYLIYWKLNKDELKKSGNIKIPHQVNTP